MAGELERYAFGWIEQPVRYETPQLSIFPNEEHAQWVRGVLPRASERWIYNDHVERLDQHDAGFTIRWTLPSTHWLTLAPEFNDAQLADFLVLCIGFALGLNLKPAGMGHLHRTPRQLGWLVNFAISKKDFEICTRRFIAFYRASPPKIVKLVTAALHWYLTSQSYHHAFEQFDHQYKVLDNVHLLTSLVSQEYAGLKRTHSLRPLNLAKHYTIPLPPPFKTVGSPYDNSGRLAEIRNDLVHEATWLKQPLGYAADSESWDLLVNLRNFNSQLLLATFGIKCDFRRRLYSAQTQGLDAEP